MKCECKGEECDCYGFRLIGVEKQFREDKFSKDYLDLKRRYGFKRLLIRIGDYYEAFFADAEELPEFTRVAAFRREEGVLISGFKATDLAKYQKALEMCDWKIVEDFCGLTTTTPRPA